MTDRFRAVFGGGKVLIAMAHVPPLPGTPLYGREEGVEGLIESVRRDLDTLLGSDFDAILFCNEGDRPYSLKAGYEGVAVMSRVVSELAPRDRPFGVDFLWDASAALAIAVATGASFVRAVTTGVYESDMGLWSTDAAGLLRERRRLDADKVALLMNITPEFASRVGRRDIGRVARSTAVSSLADAILISGPMAGSEPDIGTLKAARDGVGGEAPVLANTGAKSTTVVELLDVCDGVIVGSDLKQDGHTWNPVEAERVRRFIEAAGR